MHVAMKWPEDRIFPCFSYDGGCLDAVESSDMSREEQVAFAALQGIVNRKGVRLLLLDTGSDEGPKTWPRTLGLSFRKTDPFTVFSRYLPEAAGALLYSEEKSRHYVNLACTAASVQNAVPMTRPLYDRLREAGSSLPVVEDLTGLDFMTPAEIYLYAYRTYWKKNTHRLLLSQNPKEAFHLRDLAAAAGCAVIFTENRREEERAVYEKFLSDMEPGRSVVAGWYTEERSGITTATAYGLSTVPADLYANFTVYAQDIAPRLCAERPAPPLEDKFYAALFVSDGDNIQYNQRFMRKFWDNSAPLRGKCCVNWTISPALVEAAPGILNYYYDSATEKDCFVSGPSGFGYAMPVNTLDEEIPAGNYVRDDSRFAEYVRLSNRYFAKAGLRAVTVWDNLTESQREIYTRLADHLYGLTVQLFTEDKESVSSFCNGMPVKQLTPCYSTTLEHLSAVLTREVTRWKGDSPSFLAAQFSVWGRISLADLPALEEKMNGLAGGRFAFVRADDFFRLMRAAREQKSDS